MCYYQGSTLNAVTNAAGSGKERIHFFNSQQCSFDTEYIPQCNKAWVKIKENCGGWTYCADTLTQQASDVVIYHKGGNLQFNGNDIDFCRLK